MFSQSLSNKPRAKDSDNNMIPMINVVFLLLIFFMIAGTVRKIHSQDIELPKSSSQKMLTPNAIDLSITKGNTLRINGDLINISLLQQTITDLLKKEDAKVSIRADKQLQAKDLDAVLNILRAEGVELIRLYSLSSDSQ